VPVPIKSDLVSKVGDINGLIERTWTDQEVSEKLKRQNALHIKYSGVERDQLTKQLDVARARGDTEAINRLQEKIDNLETPRLAFRTSLNSAKKKTDARGPTQQEKLALLNLENRRKNAESVRKAQLLERARAREADARPGQEGADSQSGTSTPATANGNANGGGSGNGTPKQGGKALLPHIAKLQELQRSQAKPGMPVIHKPLMDDDIIGALDLDIDVEID
jgi:RNA polymerase-associated protein RTF1